MIDCFMYADDIITISETKKGLQEQLKACEDHGKTLGLNFNPEKSTYMIFNSNKTKNKKLQTEDLWQGNLKIDQTTLKQVQNMKYLGYIITDNLKEDNHIDKRIYQMNKSIGKLTALGLTSEMYHPMLKAQMIKAYIRPVLTYGLENIYRTRTHLSRIKRQEGNLIKNALKIPRTCHSKDLYAALNIDQTINYINRTKIKFLLRLNKNQITRELLKMSIELKDTNSLTTEIANILNASNQYNYESLIENANDYIIEDIKKVKETKKINNSRSAPDKIQQIKKICNSKDRNTISGKLFDLVKLDFIN